MSGQEGGDRKLSPKELEELADCLAGERNRRPQSLESITKLFDEIKLLLTQEIPKTPSTKYEYHISLMEYVEYLFSQERHRLGILGVNLFNTTLEDGIDSVTNKTRVLAILEQETINCEMRGYRLADDKRFYPKDWGLSMNQAFPEFFSDICIGGYFYSELITNMYEGKSPDILGLMKKTRSIPRKLTILLLDLLKEGGRLQSGDRGKQLRPEEEFRKKLRSSTSAQQTDLAATISGKRVKLDGDGLEDDFEYLQ